MKAKQQEQEPFLKRAFKGTSLEPYVEAAKVRTLDEFKGTKQQ